MKFYPFKANEKFILIKKIKIYNFTWKPIFVESLVVSSKLGGDHTIQRENLA